MAARSAAEPPSWVGPRECVELPQPEVAIVESRMGNDQRLVGHGLPLELHDIEVERPRAPPLAAHAAGAPLDGLQRLEQCMRGELRLDGDHLIEVASLARRPDGFCFFRRCYGEHRRLWETG